MKPSAGSALEWAAPISCRIGGDKNPATGSRVTVAELHRFARDTLRLDYVFWGTQERYYSTEILPYLRSLKSGDR